MFLYFIYLSNVILKLTKDSDEVKVLLEQASRQRVKDLLTIELRKIDTEIINLKESVASADSVTSATNNALSSNPKRYVVELKTYAWDQSEKYVKIFVTFDGETEPLNKEMVDVEFTERSINLKITNYLSKDHSLIINNLLDPIDVEKCHWKVKKDMVTVFMKKMNENCNWTHITSTEKRLKESKSKTMEDDMKLGDSSDPSAGLMNVLKKMYDSGDPETKRMINKAWHEGQEKKGANKNFEL